VTTVKYDYGHVYQACQAARSTQNTQLLNAPLEFVATVTPHSTDDRSRFLKCDFKLTLKTSPNVENGDLENHRGLPAEAGV
jgi:hypothetical protein